MRILSCNVRYSGAKDGDNIWANRKQLCIDVIRTQNPDIVCCQEVEADQLSDLNEGLPGFEWSGMVDDPHALSPVNAIFYRRDQFRRISTGGYWLSETPHICGSRSWKSDCVRLCNWMRLADVTSGKDFRVVNTHLDHVSQPAREQQARLINEDAASYPGDYPQILTGDMNSNAANPVLLSYVGVGWKDTYTAVHGAANPGNTIHRFLGPAYTGNNGKIDWILVRGDVRTRDAAIIRTSANGRYPSDHYFISADILL